MLAFVRLGVDPLLRHHIGALHRRRLRLDGGDDCLLLSKLWKREVDDLSHERGTLVQSMPSIRNFHCGKRRAGPPVLTWEHESPAAALLVNGSAMRVVVIDLGDVPTELRRTVILRSEQSGMLYFHFSPACRARGCRELMSLGFTNSNRTTTQSGSRETAQSQRHTIVTVDSTASSSFAQLVNLMQEVYKGALFALYYGYFAYLFSKDVFAWAQLTTYPLEFRRRAAFERLFALAAPLLAFASGRLTLTQLGPPSAGHDEY